MLTPYSLYQLHISRRVVYKGIKKYHSDKCVRALERGREGTGFTHGSWTHDQVFWKQVKLLRLKKWHDDRRVTAKLTWHVQIFKSIVQNICAK